MHGKKSISKSLDAVRRRAINHPTVPAAKITIGDWQLKQNDDGDLIVMNVFTGTYYILASEMVTETEKPPL